LPPPRFYFGAMSPYSWFAAERIPRLLPEAQWRGVFAGALFKANDRASWGLGERRAEGIADCEARAAARGLGPIHWPAPWPTSDLLVARAMAFAEKGPPSSQPTPEHLVAAGGGSGMLVRFALVAMRLAFLEGADLGELEAVLEAGRRAGIDAQELRDALAEEQIKTALRGLTDEALALGVFGVPTVAVGGSLFWGDDRLEDAARAYRSGEGA
jgi:2-hydroxychromene-2-carboxylate isomerase